MSTRRVILLPQPRVRPPQSMADGWWAPIEVLRRAHRVRFRRTGTWDHHRLPAVIDPKPGWCEECTVEPTDYYYHNGYDS